MLSESTGNVLDDQDLIETLEDSKFTSNVITNRMRESVDNQKVNQSTLTAQCSLVHCSVYPKFARNTVLLQRVVQFCTSRWPTWR